MTKQVCPHCYGTIMGGRKLKLETSVAHHLESCPAELRIKKKPVKVVDVPAEVLTPRKRLIPRQPD